MGRSADNSEPVTDDIWRLLREKHMHDDRDESAAGINTRRGFLRTAAVGAGSLLLPLGVHAAASLPIQPAAFEVTQGGALIWIASSPGAELAIEVAADEAMTNPRRIAVTGLDPGNDYTGAIAVDGLEPDRVWFFRVIDVKSQAAVSRIGRFRTAPSAPRAFTFAWSGDMDERYQPFQLFDLIGARDPEFFLHLGDSIYADVPRARFNPSVTFYRHKHRANRRDAHVQQFMLRHPTFAIWDDHETDNNCHSGHPHMSEARGVFKEYWPCRSIVPDGLHRRFSWAGVDFVVLDTRSYRSAQNATDDVGKTMLGEAQKRWLLDALEASKAPFKFVITSVPFQGGGVDTWGSYRTERSEIAEFIRSRGIRGVVFLTADYHLARDWSNPKAPYREFMAGPIATFTHYSRNPAARERYEKSGRFHYGDGYNFGLVHVDPAAARASVSFVDHVGRTLTTIDIAA